MVSKDNLNVQLRINYSITQKLQFILYIIKLDRIMNIRGLEILKIGFDRIHLDE